MKQKVHFVKVIKSVTQVAFEAANTHSAVPATHYAVGVTIEGQEQLDAMLEEGYSISTYDTQSIGDNVLLITVFLQKN